MLYSYLPHPILIKLFTNGVIPQAATMIPLVVGKYYIDYPHIVLREKEIRHAPNITMQDHHLGP